MTSLTTSTAADVAPGRTANESRGRRKSDALILLHQIRYEQLGFWRNTQAMIFTFVFPVVFVAIIGAVFGGAKSSDFFYGHTGMEYYTATIAAVSVLGACYGQ